MCWCYIYIYIILLLICCCNPPIPWGYLLVLNPEYFNLKSEMKVILLRSTTNDQIATRIYLPLPWGTYTYHEVLCSKLGIRNKHLESKAFKYHQKYILFAFKKIYLTFAEMNIICTLHKVLYLLIVYKYVRNKFKD